MANPKLVLRSADVWVMYGLNNLPPFSVAGPVGLLAAINKEQGITLLTRQITFGVPTPTSGDTLYNTRLVLDSVVGQGYKGSFTLRYNRVNLSVAFNGKTLVNLPTLTATILELLPAINAQYTLGLTASDIVDGPIDPEAAQLTLTVKSSSEFYVPGSTMVVGLPLPLFSTLFTDPIIRWA